MKIVNEPPVEARSSERRLKLGKRFRPQHRVALLRRSYRAPFSTPLTYIFAALPAVDVVNHAAAAYEQPQHFAQRRFVIKAADCLWSGSVSHGLGDSEHDRGPNSPYLRSQIFFAGSLHLAKGERTRQKSGQQVNDLARGGRDHLIHAICHDGPCACENSFSIWSASDEPRDSAGFVDRDLLIPFQRVLVASDLCNDRVTQSESLVAMLLHIFDLLVAAFGNIDRAHCFEETERDYGVYSAGHLVDRRRAQANRRSNCLQA